jgi:hypothetical protein
MTQAIWALWLSHTESERAQTPLAERFPAYARKTFLVTRLRGNVAA